MDHPDADIKIYLTAAAEDRANRRYLELLQRGQQAEYEQVLKDIIERDCRDMNRETAPLKQAEDAILVDTTGVGLEEKKRRMTPAMEPNEKTQALCALAKEITEDMGYPFTLKKRGGLSDANHIAVCGCATLDALGPTGDFDHSEDEYLELSTIQPNLEFSHRLLCRLAEQKG